MLKFEVVIYFLVLIEKDKTMEPVKFIITQDLLASRGLRFLNCLLDLMFVYILGLSAAASVDIIADMTYNHSLSAWIENMDKATKLFFGILIMLFYYGLTEFYLSRSVAKYITKTVVVMEDGSRPDRNTILKRTLCRLIPVDMFTFLGADARGWHDTFSQTYVVKKHRFNSKKGHIPFYG